MREINMNEKNMNQVTNEKVSPGKAILRALGYGGVYLGGQVAGGMAVGAFSAFKVGYDIVKNGGDSSQFSNDYLDYANSLTGPMVVIAAIVTIAFLFLYYKINDKKMSEEVNFKKSVGVKKIALFAGLGIALNYITIAVLTLLPESVMSGYAESSSVLDNQSILTMIGTAIAAPIIEEIIFRGLIFDRLKKGMPVVLAAIISATVFGLAHGQIVWICYAGILGLIFAYVYHKTGSIKATIALHMAYNSNSVILSALPIDMSLTFKLVIASISVVAIFVGLVVAKKISAKKDIAEIEVVTTAA